MTPKRAPILLLALFVAAAAFPLGGRAGAIAGDPAPSLLERPLTLDLWGVTLSEAAKAITEQTGVDIVFFLADFPAEKNTKSVFLVTGRVSLATVMECLGRRYGFRYRLGDTGRLEVAKSYDWIPPDQYAARFIGVNALLAPGGADMDRLRGNLVEFAKPLALLGGDYSLALALTPGAGGGGTTRAEVVLPPVLADYFQKAVKCLSGDAGDYQPGAPEAKNRPPGAPTARQPGFEWERMLNRDMIVPRDLDVHAALKSVCEQAGIAVILESPPPAGLGSPFSRPGPDRVSLGKLMGDLAEKLALNRRVFLASGGVAFETAQKPEWENDARCREFFWSGLGVAGFDARRAAERAGGPDVLVRTLRESVFPCLWRDPVTAIGYSPVTGRLAVIAPHNVLSAIAARLQEMEKGGR